MFQWGLSFFGLRPEDRPIIHSEIFDLVFYGNGGFNFNDLYEMPIYLRKFYFKKLQQALDKEKANSNSISNQNKRQIKK